MGWPGSMPTPVGSAMPARNTDSSRSPGSLRELAELLATPLNEQELPDRDLGERLCALAQTLDELVPPAPEPELPEPVEAYEAIEDSQATAAAGAVEDSDASPEDDVDIWGDGVALFGPGKPKAETVAPHAGRSQSQDQGKGGKQARSGAGTCTCASCGTGASADTAAPPAMRATRAGALTPRMPTPAPAPARRQRQYRPASPEP